MTVVNIAKVVSRIIMNQQYDSGVVDLSSFDPTWRASMEQDYKDFWKNATKYLDHMSLILMFTALAALPIVILAYIIDFKQRGGVLQNRGSYKTDQEFKKYFWTNKGFF